MKSIWPDKKSLHLNLSSRSLRQRSALLLLLVYQHLLLADFRFIYLYFGAIVGRSILAIYYLPKIYGEETTIYEKITDNPSSRRLITSVYMLTKFLSIGVRLYSGSILIAAYFDLNIYVAILILSVITMLYTMIGGLRAVIKTDFLQTLVFTFGGIAAHFIIPKIANKNWSEMIYHGFSNDKIITLDIEYFKIILVGFLGGIIFDMATHGVDQDFAQRLLATKNLKSSQRSIVLSSLFSIFIGLIFLSIGTLLWSYHQDFPIPTTMKVDYVFANFITKHFPAPVKGLMLAGVLAATMSTLDSTINALSSCMTTDIFPNRNPQKIRSWIKIDAVMITIILVLISFIASKSTEVLTLGLKIASWSGGFLLFCLTFSVFQLGKLTTKEYFIAYLINLSGIGFSSIYLGWHLAMERGVGSISNIIIFSYGEEKKDLTLLINSE